MSSVQTFRKGFDAFVFKNQVVTEKLVTITRKTSGNYMR